VTSKRLVERRPNRTGVVIRFVDDVHDPPDLPDVPIVSGSKPLFNRFSTFRLIALTPVRDL
jgi:hypothetical protein